MSFNFFTTKRVFRIGQYDGINDFVAFDLSGDKRPLVQFLVGEFHSSAICKRFDPLVAHSAPPNGGSVEIIRALKTQTHESVSYGPWHMVDEIRWDEKAGLRRDAVRSQVIDVLEAQIKRRP